MKLYKGEFLEKNEFLFKEDEMQFLIRLGLSLPQARVFLALTRLNRAVPARTVSAFSKVARHDVYRILAELYEKGLIEKDINTPTRFRANFANGISILLEHRNKEGSELQTKAMEFFHRHRDKTAEATLQEEETHFFLLPGKGAFLQRQREMLKKAQISINAVTTLKRFQSIVSINGEDIKQALKRGVQLRVVIQKPEDENSRIETVNAFKRNPLFRVRYSHTPPRTILAIIDKKEVTIVTLKEANLDASPSLWSNNPSLIEIAQDSFEKMWNEAKD